MEMLHSWGMRSDVYDRMPRWRRQEKFMWWQAKIERDRVMAERAEREQVEAQSATAAAQRSKQRRR